jgi:hypothetical protein
MTAQQPQREQPIWTYATETCNGERFYPLLRINEQWGYANSKQMAELMVRALNRDMEARPHPQAPERNELAERECAINNCMRKDWLQRHDAIIRQAATLAENKRVLDLLRIAFAPLTYPSPTTINDIIDSLRTQSTTAEQQEDRR